MRISTKVRGHDPIHLSRGCILLLILLGAIGCSSFGPSTVVPDQFDYAAAIADSEREQLLANLVRLRYSESPTFLRVSSVISSYSRIGTVSTTVGINTGTAGDNTAAVGGRATWMDRPTITYVPISGQQFSQNLLTPITPEYLLGLLQSGWSAEVIGRMCIWSINNVDNDSARRLRRRQADPEFVETFELWRRLRQDSAVGFRNTADTTGSSHFYMVIRPKLSLQSQADIARLREILELSPDAQEYRIVYGIVPEMANDIAVLTGSIMDIMLNLAGQFNVPSEHIRDGLTVETFESLATGGIPHIDVQFSEAEPEDAFVRILAHGYWFFISQRDQRSKTVFTALQFILTLAETPLPDRSPVVTIQN